MSIHYTEITFNVLPPSSKQNFVVNEKIISLLRKNTKVKQDEPFRAL